MDETEWSLGQTGCADSSEEKVFRAHAPPQGTYENPVCALKLLANQQTGRIQPRVCARRGISGAKQIEDSG